MNKREHALNWWNHLPFDSINTTISKTHYARLFFNGRNYQSLTGREIEIIWSKVVCEKCGGTLVEKEHVGSFAGIIGTDTICINCQS